MKMWWLEPSRYIGSWGDRLTWRRTEWQVWSVPNPACASSQELTWGNSPAVQWLRLWASTARGLGPITGQGTDLMCLRAKKKKKQKTKQKQYCNKFNKDLKWCTSIILKKKNLLCTSLPNSTFNDDMLVDWNQLWQWYLHQGNWELLQIRKCFPREIIYQPSTEKQISGDFVKLFN